MFTEEDSRAGGGDAGSSSERSTRDDAGQSRDGDVSMGRRSLLQAGAAAGVGAFGFAGVASADHYDDVSPADRNVDGDSCLEWGGGDLSAGDASVFKNDWATGGNCDSANTEICISTYGDGSFGWEWARGETCIHGEDLPNYPQALIGQKIGGTSSGWRGLPEQNGNIESLDVEIDVEMDISDGEWNFMLEWWMEHNSITGDPSDEILIVLDDSPLHDKGEPEVTEAFEDDYGNVIDYWENDIEGGEGADWNFHIFRVQGDEPPSHLDCRSILDYLVEDPEGQVADGGGTYDGSKLVSGIEIGNEIWDNNDGETTVNQFNVRVETTDGQEHLGTAGVNDFWSEPENLAPSAPGDLSVSGVTQTSVDLSWSAASDPDDSGIDSYVVAGAGTEQTVQAPTTSTTVDGLESGTDYEFTVTAVDEEGAESTPSDSVTATTEEEAGACDDAASSTELSNGQTVCDIDGNGEYRDVNGDGSVSNGDVTDFFSNQHVDPWDSRPGMFDFDGDGDVGQGDVVDLFEYVN